MIQDRIKKLRALMAERKIDVYYIPNEDDHLSDEYTSILRSAIKALNCLILSFIII